jgi:hypothetical protein
LKKTLDPQEQVVGEDLLVEVVEEFLKVLVKVLVRLVVV